MRIVDAFAGGGGWDEGLRMLGHEALGIEWDAAACATGRAAGHERLQADVAALDPLNFPCDGFIGSPPCPSFSAAGKGAGRRDVDHVIACANDLAAGRDTRDEHRKACEDERSILSVEPLRWALCLEPQWIALEQVPPVLEIWKVFARLLEARGYRTWAGVLEAERYGVPQTRERAILMARRDGKPCHPPRATYQRYVLGEPARHDVTLEGEVLPWVSMAEALTWMPDGQRRDSGPGAERDPRPADAPSYTIRANGSGSAPAGVEWVHNRPATTIAGDPRVSPPHGHDERQFGGWVDRRPATTLRTDERVSNPGRHEPGQSGSQTNGAVRVSVQEAAVLQSFRPDYPWQGTRTQVYQQVGNAVPPLLARAILGELVGP